MKKTISSLFAAALLAGCANMQNPLDKQGSSKTAKTAQAAGFGATLGFVAGKVFGIDPNVTAVFGGLLGGFAEWNHETKREIDLAQAEADRLKAAHVDAEVKQAKVEIKDEKGVSHTSNQLTSFSVHATNDVAVKSVSSVINQSAFEGQVVIVAKKSQQRQIEAGLKAVVDSKAKLGKPVKVAFYDQADVGKGIKPGIAWVPVHRSTVVADSGRKGGAV